MGDNERRPRPQTTTDLAKRLQTPVAGNEMKRQKTDGAVERPFRRGIYVTLMKMHAGGVPAGDLFRRLQHVGRRIDAVEGPPGVIVGERLQFKAAARPENKHPPMRGDALGEKQRGHAMQAGEAGNLPRRPFSVGARMCGGKRLGF